VLGVIPYGEIMKDSQNPLEIALAHAANEPASRPEFYRLLLESEIYVIGYTDLPGQGQRTLPVGARLSITHWEKRDGTSFIPFFTSIEALRRALKEEARFVAMPARNFFEITRGATLVLNLASSHYKEFFPNEIDALLATGVNHVAATRVVEKPTRVLLGQPAKYPSEMVLSLAALMAKHPNVKAAYLCLMHDQESVAGAVPTLVVGIEGEGDIKIAMREAGSVAADTVPPGEAVDLFEVRREEAGISAYFVETVKPFYERR
jgi:type III secretion system (T3SS) SseB-like protein